MKKILLSILLFFISVPAFSQLAYITFEQDSPDSLIVTDSSNLWEIGIAHKTFLNTDSNNNHVIVTDTSGFYPNNIHSSFIIKPFCCFQASAGIRLEFKSKMDADTLRDGGYVEFSIDEGYTWTNVKYDNSFFVDTYLPDTLLNGEYGFTGKTDWRTVDFNYCFFSYQPVSIMYRFTFVGDSIDNSREGWMIDDLTLNGEACEGIQEINTNYHFSSVFPNPVSNTSFLKIQNQNSLISQVDFYDALGRKISTLNSLHQSNLPLSKDKFGEGIFFYRVELSNHKTDSGLFVVQ